MSATPFPLLPDGGSSSTERFEFGTALTTAYDGTEAAQATRSLPRITFSATYAARASSTAGAAALAFIQAGGLVHIPLGCHAAAASALDALDFGINADQPLCIAGLAGGAVALEPASLSVLPPGSVWVAPSADAWLASSREIDWPGGDIFRTKLTFSLTDAYREAVVKSAGALAFPTISGVTATPVETRTAQQDTVDYGRRWLLQQRYIKRAVKLSIGLKGRAAIGAFRTFLYGCQGRLNTFPYQLPMDSVAKTWRLSTDTVELEYVTRNFVKCSLELAEVDQ